MAIESKNSFVNFGHSGLMTLIMPLTFVWNHALILVYVGHARIEVGMFIVNDELVKLKF